nr:v-Bcl-2 protein [Bovine gammaherpesvirus 4]
MGYIFQVYLSFNITLRLNTRLTPLCVKTRQPWPSRTWMRWSPQSGGSWWNVVWDWKNIQNILSQPPERWLSKMRSKQNRTSLTIFQQILILWKIWRPWAMLSLHLMTTPPQTWAELYVAQHSLSMLSRLSVRGNHYWSGAALTSLREPLSRLWMLIGFYRKVGGQLLHHSARWLIAQAPAFDGYFPCLPSPAWYRLWVWLETWYILPNWFPM